MRLSKLIRVILTAGLLCGLLMSTPLRLSAWAATTEARAAAISGDGINGEGAAGNSDSAADPQSGRTRQVTAITINGRTLTGPNSSAQSLGGRLFLPVTSIARALGDRVSVDATSRTITIRRQTGVTADFSAQLNQVRENGSVVLSVSDAAGIVFPPEPEGLMLPVEIVSALLDASIVLDDSAKAIRVTRGPLQANTVREGERHALVELYQVDYEYNFNDYGQSSNQSLTLRSSGRIADGRFNLITNSTAGKGTDLSLLRNGTLTYERPNGQRLVIGNFGTGTDLEFISATVRGAEFQLPVRGARVTAFGGRAISGVLPSQPLEVADIFTQTEIRQSRLSYDTNIFGAYATFEPSIINGLRSGLFSLSSGAFCFSGPQRSGEMLAGGVRYASVRSRLQAEVGLGKFKGTQREGERVDGVGLAADVSGSFNLMDNLTVQGRYAYTSENFLSLQSGLHDPINLVAGGVTWRANEWLTASLSGSTSTRPGTTTQRDRFITSTVSLTPRAGLPSIFFSHTESSTLQLRNGEFTLLNAAKDFSRGRFFLNATRVKTIGPANLNLQFGAFVRFQESSALQLSQSFGSGGALGGTVDWQTQSLFDNRLSFSAGLGYNRSSNAQMTYSERASTTVRLPRESTMQVSYLQTQTGPTVLLSLHGSLLKKRGVERAANASVKEMNLYGSFSGRVYQDMNANGRFDLSIDRPQANVKVRVDGNRYVVTDENGRFRIDEVRAGEHNVYLDLLSVRADLTLLDGPQQAATLLPGRDIIVDFRLARTGRMSGVVWLDQNENGFLDEGEQPLADVRIVMANGRDTLTDTNGVFIIGDLPPGEYTVLVDEKTLPEKTKTAGGSRTVKVLAGSETGDVKFAIVPLPPEVKKFSSN